ncbi:hypothetical protein RhiLY_11270 [Ceratobasidium sp. AG-Ba]|nr:hypothetical protein RhiLY_11270 [Ceratobasidium sp. AG-Ba]
MQTWLLRNWTRTCAIQCTPFRNGFDKIIPVYNLGRLEASSTTPFHEHDSFILISDKAGQESSEHTLGTNWLEQANLPSLGQPFIAIVADLGLEHHGSTFTLEETSVGPVLAIHAPGLGSGTYPGLADWEIVSKLRGILQGPTERTGKGGNEKTYAELCVDFDKRLEHGGSLDDSNMAWESSQLPVVMIRLGVCMRGME